MNAPVRARGGLKQAQTGGAHRNDSAPAPFCLIERARDRATHLAPFGMEMMLMNSISAHGGEGALSHMESDIAHTQASLLPLSEQRRRDMQPRGRGGDGALMTRKERLIVFFILRVTGAAARDIRRQRHHAQFMEARADIAAFIKLQQAVVVASADITRVQVVGKMEARAFCKMTGGIHQSSPQVFFLLLREQAGELPFAIMDGEGGGAHFGVIEHNMIAAPKHLCQLGHAPMRAMRRVNSQQAGSGARARGTQRDLRCGKVEVIQTFVVHQATID